MRIAGIILIIAGVLMFAFTTINFQTKKTVVDIGPVQIDKKENHQLEWPSYLGGLVAIAGVVLVVTAPKKA